ncbi:helix-turn-helix transcriptional regulator [Pseudooceanicola sp. CBS1P-1]|uniref:Helix-turn-helix domain-containing protein n=1 Tax=Pseudooceanicola albus TaxID=2692189 RepID=A0A6L7G8E3_9RHOB|nr:MULTISPECIES: helix-turn-helix transcriptional regulator [Pseudooceanicola]MBT9385969.1 helix-turn-helix transcriptional regulator [Pseudooceanicola endophyticus]MXN19610.1 helix-turn-helix domain-containing protein [Pseudooceanicola albus]
MVSRGLQVNGRDLAAQGASIGGALPLPEGVTGRQEVLPSGALLEVLSGAPAARSAQTRMRPEGLALYLVTEGRIPAQVAGLPLDLARAPGRPAHVVLSALEAPAEARHRMAAGQRIGLLTLRLGWDWLAARGLSRDAVLAGRAHRCDSWLAAPGDVFRAEALIRAEGSAEADSPVLTLRREALALSLLAQASEVLLGTPDGLRPTERERLRRMEDLATRPGPLPTLEDIAAAGRMSVSSMQRLFQRAHGQAVLGWARGARMQQATAALRRGESVAEAARIAGYATPAAFSTAFRELTGTPPSRFAKAG